VGDAIAGVVAVVLALGGAGGGGCVGWAAVEAKTGVLAVTLAGTVF